MKRFFCTVCKKVKRVRKMPRVIENVTSTTPVERVGVCNHHMVKTTSNYKVTHVAS